MTFWRLTIGFALLWIVAVAVELLWYRRQETTRGSTDNALQPDIQGADADKGEDTNNE